MSDQIDNALKNLQDATQKAANAVQAFNAFVGPPVQPEIATEDQPGLPGETVLKVSKVPMVPTDDVKLAAQNASMAAQTLYNAASTVDVPEARPAGDPMLDAAQKVAQERTSGDECTVLWGYLETKPDINGQLHLYLSRDLNEYLVINNVDKVANVSLNSDLRPLSGSLVWVKASAIIKRVREEVAATEGQFLKGAISKGFLQQLNVSSMLGLPDLVRGAAEPGSGGGCGTGAALVGCG